LVKIKLKMKKLIIASFVTLTLISCKKKETPAEETDATTTTTGNTPCPTCNFPDTVFTSSAAGPKLVFKFKFDSTQARLNNLGQPTVVAVGNAAQCPKFNGMSAHYIEMAQNDFTQVGQGAVLYKAPETECGGSKAITFCESIVSKEGDVCFSIPISSITPGTYKWLRVSLAYQNYDIKVRANGQNLNGTIASFVGFKTYVTKYKMKNAVMTPTAGGTGNHTQGYWGFWTSVSGVEYKADGQSEKTTVVNPNPNSPIPAGSCLVTGEFVQNASPTVGAPLVITGSESSDIIITISLSTNKSFEWKELTADGLFEPGIGETVVDMGLRGLVPKY
jgi:hypothetical protein